MLWSMKNQLKLLTISQLVILKCNIEEDRKEFYEKMITLEKVSFLDMDLEKNMHKN